MAPIMIEESPLTAEVESLLVAVEDRAIRLRSTAKASAVPVGPHCRNVVRMRTPRAVDAALLEMGCKRADILLDGLKTWYD